MIQRSLALFGLLVLVGLWLPVARTNAQTGCPSGGCKTYLPVVHTPQYVTGTAVMIGESYRGCIARYAQVTYTNVSTTPVAAIVSTGEMYSYEDIYDPDDPEKYDTIWYTNTFAYTTTDVLLPGRSFSYPVDIDGCTHYPAGSRVDVRGVTPIDNVAEVVVETKQRSDVSSCFYGSRTFVVSGTIRNAGTTTLTDVKAFATFHIASGYANVDDTTLAPGETTRFQQALSYSTDPVSPCPDPFPIDRFYDVHAWGTVAP